MYSNKKQVKRQIKNRMSARNNLRLGGTPPQKQSKGLSRNEIRRGNSSNGVIKNKNIVLNKLINNLPSPEKRFPISIIITAYNTQNFIEETLNSIENQTYFINNNQYEILIGVDACEKTLQKILEIKHKYRNITTIMMDENVGTYITTNTLLDLVKYDNILRFDSDDIMYLNMIEETIYHMNHCDIVRVMCEDFKIINNKKEHSGHKRFASGVILFKKDILLNIGGYQSWECAADSELLKRVDGHLKSIFINQTLFDRRVHDNNLSINNRTGVKSKLRKKYHEFILNIVSSDNQFVEKITGKYKIINDKKNNINNNYSI